MSSLPVLAALLFAAMLAAAPLAGQDVALRPALLGDDDGVVPALRVSVDYESAGLETAGAFPREWAWGLGLDAPLAWDADRNPERLAAEGRFGGRISLYRPPAPVADPTPEEGTGAERWDYGYLALQLRVGVEAPQGVDFVHTIAGASLGYEHDRYEALWFLPEARVDVGLVACAGCDRSMPLSVVPTGGPDTRHGRLDVDVRWNLMLDRSWMPAAGKPLWLRLRGRAFTAWGMPTALALSHEEQGVWAGVELAYEIDRVRWLDEVHVGWTGGEIPVRLGDRRAWTVGATVVP